MYVCGLAALSAAFLRNRKQGRTNNILWGAPVHVVLTGSSCMCINSSEFAQLGNNVGKVRMTQLTAYLFVAIPISLGGKYISRLHEGQISSCVQTVFWCRKEWLTNFRVTGFLCNNLPVIQRLNCVFLWVLIFHFLKWKTKSTHSP